MKACNTTIGRRYKEKIDTLIKDPFLNDYTKIIQSKAYRRLAYKTQVMSLPDNPHIRTRLVHTNEVVAISVSIAEQLGLNIPLCMAIAAAHDIGHTPYGHLGEAVLTKMSGKKFKHTINSVVVVQHIERRGRGLNLTFETLEGITKHSLGGKKHKIDLKKPQEYYVVMFADKIAYAFSDLNDAVRYGHLEKKDIPKEAVKLGWDQRERTNNTIKALIKESKERGAVQFSEGKEYKHFTELKSFMYEKVYHKTDNLLQENILYRIYDFFATNSYFSGVNPVTLLSLLTDKEANYFGELLLRSRKPSIEQISHFGIMEILKFLKKKKIDHANIDLDWGK